MTTMRDRLENLALARAMELEPSLMNHDCIAVDAIRSPLKAGGRWSAVVYCCQGSMTFECGTIMADCARSVH